MNSERLPGVDSSPLDHLARQALRHYRIGSAHLSLLRQGDNTVYLVQTGAGAGAGERWVLRLHTSARHSEQAVTSELIWLDHLSRAAFLPVPQPVMTTAGGWVVRLGNGARPPVMASLLCWVDGEALTEDGGLTLTQAAEAGALLAELHAQTQHFAPPGGFERPRYDLPYFRRCADELIQALIEHVDSGKLSAVRRRLGTLADSLPDLRELPGGYGLIHADPHPGNFVQGPSQLGLIDFDRCGWGPFLLDLAHISLALGAPTRRALMTGYLSVRPLPGDHESALRHLRVLAATENLAFLARRPHERPFVIAALASVEAELTELGY